MPSTTRPSNGPCVRRRASSQALKAANLLPPVFVCTIMCTIWSVYAGLHLLPLLQVEIKHHLRNKEDSLRGIVHFMISQVLVVLVFVCYGRAMLTMPGTVPDTPEWSLVGGHEARLGQG